MLAFNEELHLGFADTVICICRDTRWLPKSGYEYQGSEQERLPGTMLTYCFDIYGVFSSSAFNEKPHEYTTETETCIRIREGALAKLDVGL